jgi:hypothetical protein
MPSPRSWPESFSPGAIRASRRMSVRRSRSRTKRPSWMWPATWSARRRRVLVAIRNSGPIRAARRGPED